MKSNQQGAGALEMILLVVLAGIIGVVGWYIYQANQDVAKDGSGTTTSQGNIPEVNNAQDLQASEDYLNSSDLDKELNTSEVDAALSQ